MADVLEQAKKIIPAEVRMISGCQDVQTSADVSNVSSFQLPDPAGQAGGACTSSLLKILYADHHKPDKDLSFQEVLLAMRGILSKRQYTQIPQLTSSRPLDIHERFELVPADCTGTSRALLIGINYVGQQGELSGCHNDVFNIKEYIMDVWGFEEKNITVLLDDGKHTEPTKYNILQAYRKLVSECQDGDAAFCHYSGHGGKLRDDDGDEKDGYDETLVPVDYIKTGQIRDDDLFSNLIAPMKSGVTLTCIMDCCHSGTVLDLPFQFKANGEQEAMLPPSDFDFGPLAALAASFASGGGGNVSFMSILSMIGNFLTGRSGPDQDLTAIANSIKDFAKKLLAQLRNPLQQTSALVNE